MDAALPLCVHKYVHSSPLRAEIFALLVWCSVRSSSNSYMSSSSILHIRKCLPSTTHEAKANKPKQSSSTPYAWSGRLLAGGGVAMGSTIGVLHRTTHNMLSSCHVVWTISKSKHEREFYPLPLFEMAKSIFSLLKLTHHRLPAPAAQGYQRNPKGLKINNETILVNIPSIWTGALRPAP